MTLGMKKMVRYNITLSLNACVSSSARKNPTKLVQQDANDGIAESKPEGLEIIGIME